MAVTSEEIQRVREYECSRHGHTWDVICTFGVGPVRVVCGHCGTDSGLVKGEQVAALCHLIDEQQGEIRGLERLLSGDVGGYRNMSTTDLTDLGMTVLFLDFDGVITCVNGSFKNANMLDEPSLDRLHEVLERTGARVVISSSWRHGRSTTELAAILRLDPAVVIDKTPGDGQLFQHDDDGRGTCIAMWLLRNGRYVKRWAIVDDDVFDMHLWQLPFIVQTDTEKGLTAEKADALVSLLSGDSGDDA